MPARRDAWITCLFLLLAASACSSRNVPAVDLSPDAARDGQVSTCVSGGKVYQVGQQWQVDCNTCRCDKDGQVLCTKKACDAGTPDMPVTCDTSKVGKMCTKTGKECGPANVCLLTGKLPNGKEVGVCTCECIVDDTKLPKWPTEYVCPGPSAGNKCAQWEVQGASKKKQYCFKPCWPQLGVRSCEKQLACVPRSGLLLKSLDKAFCLIPGCASDQDCPVMTQTGCSVAKKDCPAGQRCIAQVTGLDAGLCAKPGKCDKHSGLCDSHSLGKSTAKVGDPCKDDTECAGNQYCRMAFDQGKLQQKAGGPCKADHHCCSGVCKSDNTCAAGQPCRLLNRNGYCTIAGCVHAKTYTIRACDAGSTCSRLYSAGLCLKTCDLSKASTCRGLAKDRLGDYECRAWQNLVTGTKVVSKKPVCEPGYIVPCDLLKPPAGSSSNLSCASVGTWNGTTNDNKTKMACRDLKGKVLKDAYDPAGLCLDVTASGPPIQ